MGSMYSIYTPGGRMDGYTGCPPGVQECEFSINVPANCHSEIIRVGRREDGLKEVILQTTGH